MFVTVAGSPLTGRAQVNSGDSLALVSLYNNTTGWGWANSANWLTKAPVSKWFGVTVHNSRVDTLKLIGNQLTGTIPAQMGKLAALQYLDLEYNQLTDPLPPQLDSLHNLKKLNVVGNQLTFTSIERLVKALGNSLAFYYAPQANVPLIKSGNSLSVSVGGTPANDTFRLFRYGAAIKQQVGDSVFTVSLPGSYYITVTNAVAKQLSLSSTTATYTAPPTVTISAQPGTVVCQGTKVTFTATLSASVVKAAYQWKKNGKNVGANSATYTDSLPKNGDSVTCVFIGGGDTAKSNLLVLTVKALAPLQAYITANVPDTICKGTAVTFTAHVYPGDSVAYRWKKNGESVGTNSQQYIDSTLKTGDSVYVVIKSYQACLAADTVISKAIKFTVAKAVAPQVYITASTGDTICKGTVVTFTAHAYPGGTTAYRWKKNGKSVGTDSQQYIDSTLKTGDSVYVVIKSYQACLAVDTVVSKAIKFTVNEAVAPQVYITASTGDTVCKGTVVTFTAHAYPGGTTAYRWKKNGESVGTNSQQYIDSALKTGDSVYVVIKSYQACLAVDTVVSKAIKFTVAGLVIPSLTITSNSGDTICKKTKVVLTALPANAEGKIVFEWKKDGKVVGKDSVVYVDSTLVNGDSITCTIVVKGRCIADSIVISKTIKFTVIETPALPSAIAGPGVLKAGTITGYKVNAEQGDKFIWYVPAADSIIAGQGTDSITVKWGRDSGQAEISVKAYNKCGVSETVTKVIAITPGAALFKPADNKAAPPVGPLQAVLYPNPAIADANLQISGGAAAKVLVTVTALTGKILWHGEFAANSQVALPSSILPAGVYVISITNGKETKTLKLVKAK